MGCVFDYDELEAHLGGEEAVEGVRKVFEIRTIIRYINVRKSISRSRVAMGPNGRRILILPRFGLSMLREAGLWDRPVVNNLQMGRRVNYTVKRLNLTANQEIVLSYFQREVWTPSRIRDGTASAILVMEAGYGKTYAALAAVVLSGRKALWIVPNTSLVRQTVEVVRECLDCTIGTFYSKAKLEGDIVVTTPNSAIKYPHMDTIGIVVGDEVHTYCTDKFSKVFSYAQARRGIWMTATPDENAWGFDPVAQWDAGPLVRAASLEGWNPVDVIFQTRVTRIDYWGPPEHTEVLLSDRGSVSAPLMYTQLAGDPHRNELVATCAVHVRRQLDQDVFVFCERREHCVEIARLIGQDAAVVADNNDLKVLMGGSTDEDNLVAKRHSRIIVTTFRYSGTGVSIPRMTAVILASSRRRKMKQILWRIFRLGGDNSIQRVIYDIVDKATPIKKQYADRHRVYRTINADMSTLRIKWDQCTRAQIAATLV
jgi:superfamily II DNA or RNA helicase